MIRKAKLTDIKDILKIEQEQFESAWNEKHFIAEINKSSSYFYVLEEDDVVCGYIVAYDLNGEAEIANIAIAKIHQNRGFATKLLDFILSKFDKGTNCFLEVNEKNYKAISLYMKKGFEKIGTRNNYYGKDNAIIMKLIK